MTTKLDVFNPIFCSENSLNLLVGIVNTSNDDIGNLNQNIFSTIVDKKEKVNYYLQYPRIEELPDNLSVIYNGADKQYEFQFGDDVNLIRNAKFQCILTKATDTMYTNTSNITTNKVTCKFGTGVVTKFQFIIYFERNNGISTEYSNKGWNIEKDGSLRNNLNIGISTDDIETKLNIDLNESHKAKVLTHNDLVSGTIDISLGSILGNNHIFILDTSKQTSNLPLKVLPASNDNDKYSGIEYYFVHYSTETVTNSSEIILYNKNNVIQERVMLGTGQTRQNLRVIWDGVAGVWIKQK